MTDDDVELVARLARLATGQVDREAGQFGKKRCELSRDPGHYLRIFSNGLVRK